MGERVVCPADIPYDYMVFRIFLLLAVFLTCSSGRADAPPKICSLLKPVVCNRVIQDREIMTHASLDEVSGPLLPGQKRMVYSYYAVMLSRASLSSAKKVLTNYPLYAELVPYVNSVFYNPVTKVVHVSGGIWKWMLSSKVRFEEKGERWLHYSIVDGHFKGLEGDIFFESQGENGTIAYFRGRVTGNEWPPRFVIERGAEIIFGFTASRMRSYIESADKNIQGDKNGQVPQPRRRL